MTSREEDQQPITTREEALTKAAQDFIDKVDRGEARSVKSYAAFKAALALTASSLGEQKPVAWRVRMEGKVSWGLTYSPPKFTSGVAEAIPLYASPPSAAGWDEATRYLQKITDLAFDEDVGEPLDEAIGYANKALEALRRETPAPSGVATKKTYIKPLRTIVEIDARYANEIRDLLNARREAPGSSGVAKVIDWAKCPICDEPGMRKETDAEGHAEAAIAAANANARTCKGFATALERIRDDEPHAALIASDALRMPWDVSGMPKPPIGSSDPTADRREIVAPRVTDNDRDEITVTLAGKELRGWSYSSDQERRTKMLCARDFVEGFCTGRQS